MRLGKSGSVIVKKHTIKIILAVSFVTLLAIFAALWLPNNSLDPRDYFYTDYIPGLSNVKVVTGVRTYTELNIKDPDSITSRFGFSPFPLYVPEGFSLTKAELIDQDEGDGKDYKAVIRLRYVDNENPENFFFIIMSEGVGLCTPSDYLTHNAVTADPASYNGRFSTFADRDLCIYKYMGAKAFFSKFEFEDRLWIVHFENLTKRDIRLIITSIFIQSGDVD